MNKTFWSVEFKWMLTLLHQPLRVFFTSLTELPFDMHRLNSLYSEQRETQWTLTEHDHFPIFFSFDWRKKKLTNFAVAILTEFLIFNFWGIPVLPAHSCIFLLLVSLSEKMYQKYNSCFFSVLRYFRYDFNTEAIEYAP